MKAIFSVFLSSFVLLSQALSCTGISISTQDRKFIQARTIEWGEFPLGSKLIFSPRNQEFRSLTPEGRKGMIWRAKYGFVGISVAEDGFIGEGINEAGLNAGMFYFAHYGSLAPYNRQEDMVSVSDMELTSYLLSSFATVQEVKDAFKNIKVVPFMLERDGKAPSTAHWRVSDAKGGNIVIEIIKGRVYIYDNPIGVLTNSPDFPWQLTNLNNYVNLRPGSAAPFKLGNQTLFAVGEGSGTLGLPGDFTPPSRFVRASFFLHTAPIPKNSYEGVTQAFHLLNLFDLPIGIEYADRAKIPPTLPSATQWSAVSNQSDREFYYRTMHNSQIRKIDLKKIDFSSIPYQSLPLDQTEESFKEVLPSKASTEENPPELNIPELKPTAKETSLPPLL